MKDNKFFKIITSKYMILGIQLIISIATIYFCFKLKLIPMKYIFGIIIALLILLVAFFGIIYSGEKKSKDGTSSKRSGIIKIISLLLSITLVFGCTMLIRSDNFINKVSDAVGQQYVVSVIALKDSDIDKKSLAEKKFGVCYEKDSKTLTTALADMENEIGEQEYIKYDTYIKLADALYNKEVDCIVVGEQFRNQLQANHENFDGETKIIASYSYDAKLEVTTKKTDVTEKAFSVYVTGIDIYGSLNTVSRSDVNLIVTVNPKTKQILMTSIPRDCEINLHSNGELDKLTHTGNYGTAETINTIQDLLDMEINYFVRTNFSGMTNIVDALGGITVESDEEFDTLHGNYHIVKGINEMDGDKALCFVRERKHLKAGDFARGRNQQKVLSALIDKALSPKIITNFDKILTALEGTFETDMTSSEIRSLLAMQLDDMADWNIINVQIEGEYYDCYETYSMYGTKSDVMKPFNSHIKRVRKLINKVEEGKKITDNELKGLVH
ncbi:LCP family protein [Thomasclavelia sp.]|uniref:LCP family protein n=1 Tax=Thomasclavelia sp. TaxID=3025757 RepID=UPI00260A191E|nr:LCP family protein [Thomasclavelia sp.]